MSRHKKKPKAEKAQALSEEEKLAPHGTPKGGEKGDKKNTSLRLDNKTLKALKIRAIEEDTSIQKIVETLVEDYLKTPKDG